ncbi:MAG: alpha/beta hydrolase [Candidatus Saccharimonadales bacterium]
MQVIVNGLMTHYEESGQGKNIILLHGWGDSLKTFKDLQTTLSASFHVISVDLPGFGQTATPTSVWNLDNYAEFIQFFVEKLKLSPIEVLIGHSNGGALAIVSTAKKYISPRKLVLLAASGIRNSKRNKVNTITVIAKVGKVLTLWLPKTTRKKLQEQLYGTIGSDMLVAPHLKETFKATVKQDIQSEARLITCPTLLIYGVNDKATPPKDGELFASLIPKARLVVINNAAHFVHNDASDKVKATILEFLQ